MTVRALAEATGDARVALWIDGQPRAPLTGEWVLSRSPATGAPIAEAALGGAADVAVAVEVASRAWLAWRTVPVPERAALVVELARRIEENVDWFGLLDARDMGSPLRTMKASAAKGALYLRMSAGVALEAGGRTIPATGTGLHYTLPSPWGVVGGIAAYNHPILFACQKIGPPLIAGNTVVLKPSEQAPLSTLALAELTEDLLPPGVVNVVAGGPEAGAALGSHPAVPRITFTGGIGSALALQRSAADSGVFKELTLELGGKNPIVVCPDAPLDEAAAAIVRGVNFTRNQGQSCGATSRALVHADVHEEISERVVELVGRIELGLPELPTTEMGSLVSAAHQRRVLGFIDGARAEGARLVAGGGVPTDPVLSAGAYVEPTVFDDVTPAMAVAREEVFGPVLSLLAWTSEAEALELANASRYGLTASVWTNDIDRALRLAHGLEVGYVWVNDVETRFPGVPFGGWKMSGLGKEQALVEELLSFTRSKSVSITVRPSG